MAYKRFLFSPEEGFNDGNFYEDTPENPREILQRQHNQTRDYINSVIDTLNSDKEGSSGSESIKSPKIEGVDGNNVFTQIKDIKRQINESAETKIPDASVGEEKIKNQAVSTRKIEDGAVTTEKLSSQAICPRADEVININGVSSSLYTPIEKSGAPFMLKELASSEKFESAYGKNYNGKRYFIKDGHIYTLDLENGNVEKYSLAAVGTPEAFGVYNENTVYYIDFSTVSGKVYINIYRYEKEYEEGIKIATHEIHDTTYTSFEFIGMDIFGDYMIIAKGGLNGGFHYNNIYKIPLNELENEESFVIYHSFINEHNNPSVIGMKNDFIVGNTVFKNGDKNEALVLYANIKSCDENGIVLTNDSLLPIADINTMLPKYAGSHINIENGFLHDGYLYVYLKEYLFKTRIF